MDEGSNTKTNADESYLQKLVNNLFIYGHRS